MRVGIISLQHESNTFIQTATTLADFEYDVLATGDQIYPIFKDAAHELGGSLQDWQSPESKRSRFSWLALCREGRSQPRPLRR